MSRAYECDHCEQFFSGDPTIIGGGPGTVIERLRVDRGTAPNIDYKMFDVKVKCRTRMEVCVPCFRMLIVDALAQATSRFGVPA